MILLRHRLKARAPSLSGRVTPLAMAIIMGTGFMGLWRGDTPPGGPPAVLWGRGSWAFEVEDDRLLVGFADNVFFGVVQTSWPTVPDGSAEDAEPETAYAVLPVSHIKGELASSVTVMQLGGIQGGVLTLMEGDSLLGVGRTYLMLTRTRVSTAEDGQGPTLQLIAPGYDHLDAPTPARIAELTARFTAAYAQQIDPVELLRSAARRDPSPGARLVRSLR